MRRMLPLWFSTPFLLLPPPAAIAVGLSLSSPCVAGRFCATSELHLHLEHMYLTISFLHVLSIDSRTVLSIQGITKVKLTVLSRTLP